MQYRDVTFTFPNGATDRDKVIMVLQSPYSFVRWCRTQVGIAPNCSRPADGKCVAEQYLEAVTGANVGVSSLYTQCYPATDMAVITPTWLQRVVEYADNTRPFATYNDVANMLMLALERNELA